MLIAQISDLHVTVEGALVVGKVDSQATAAAAVARLNALQPRPDLVVITGDLVNGPKPGEYEALARLMEPLTLPWCAIPGNHDDRKGLREFCAGQSWLPAVSRGQPSGRWHRACSSRMWAASGSRPRTASRSRTSAGSCACATRHVASPSIARPPTWCSWVGPCGNWTSGSLRADPGPPPTRCRRLRG